MGIFLLKFVIIVLSGINFYVGFSMYLNTPGSGNSDSIFWLVNLACLITSVANLTISVASVIDMRGRGQDGYRHVVASLLVIIVSLLVIASCGGQPGKLFLMLCGVINGILYVITAGNILRSVSTTTTSNASNKAATYNRDVS